jgi:hypothetical protein
MFQPPSLAWEIKVTTAPMEQPVRVDVPVVDGAPASMTASDSWIDQLWLYRLCSYLTLSPSSPVVLRLFLLTGLVGAVVLYAAVVGQFLVRRGGSLSWPLLSGDFVFLTCVWGFLRSPFYAEPSLKSLTSCIVSTGGADSMVCNALSASARNAMQLYLAAVLMSGAIVSYCGVVVAEHASSVLVTAAVLALGIPIATMVFHMALWTHSSNLLVLLSRQLSRSLTQSARSESELELQFNMLRFHTAHCNDQFFLQCRLPSLISYLLVAVAAAVGYVRHDGLEVAYLLMGAVGVFLC